jgi:hypothetical protein
MDIVAFDPEGAEASPGDFIALGSRKEIKCWVNVAGRASLSWASTKIEVYDSATGGTPLTSPEQYDATPTPRSFFIKGVEASDDLAEETLLFEALHVAPYPHDIVAFTVVKVDLTPIPAGNTPELADGRICLNAQPQYKKAKWKATVLPNGTTATVIPVSPGTVTVISGAGLANGATFWVEGQTTGGDYQIKITHDALSTCTDTDGEKCFRFVLKKSAEAVLGEVKKASHGGHDAWDYSPGSAGLSEQGSDGHFCEVWPVTEPTACYADKVESEFVARELSEFGPVANGEIARNHLFNDISGVLSVTIPRTGLSITVPASTTGASARSGGAIMVGALNGAGPTTDGPIESFVDGFGFGEFSANYSGVWRPSVTTKRTFNMGASTTEKVEVSGGEAVGVSVKPGSTRKGRARAGLDIAPCWIYIGAGSWKIVP